MRQFRPVPIVSKGEKDLLDKFVKKNYSNELEKVLENKAFDEDVKNFLLSILYKIGNAYSDYEMVKQNVETKEEFIENLIENIQKNCEDIKLVKPGSKEGRKLLENRTFLVEKAENRIICFPIERKLLYCISKISKKDIIINEKYFLANETLSELINVGNNINTVEPLRDFNGYSWTTIVNEIESISHNLIYQNLRILLGYGFLNKWINNNKYIIDYMELMKNSLEEIYGENKKEEFIDTLIQLSILLKLNIDKEFKENVEKLKIQIDEEIKKVKNNSSFVEEATKTKRKLSREIKRIDETLNDKEKLKKEYEKRNENLELSKKIFSVRILSKIMLEERDNKIKELERLNYLMKPQNFVEYKNELMEKQRYLKLVKTEKYEKQIEMLLIKLQQLFLKGFIKKIQNAQNKQEIIKLIYELRYYCILPFDNKKIIWQVESLEKCLKRVVSKLIIKAQDLKVINKISTEEEIDIKILKNIFTTRIINLEELNIKIKKEKEHYYIQLFDENVIEEIIEIEQINSKELEIKLNKKIKLFN